MKQTVNIDFKTDGTLTVRKGWKTFRGMVYQLKLMNNRYKKLGVKARYTIELPLP